MNEFDIITKYFSPLAAHPASLGLSDDAAIIPLTNELDYIITKDVLTENRHFFPGEEPENVAIKLMRRNISDLAAMGAKPCFYLLACIYSSQIDEAWIARFAAALKLESQEFGISLIGGDSSGTDCERMHFSLTAIGTCPKGAALKRSGAVVGDDVYVSGNIGDGYLGYLGRKSESSFSRRPKADMESSANRRNISPLSRPGSHGAKAPLDDEISHYLKPTPRINLGQKLLGIANSCIDVSDGLLQDLGHICKTSKVGMDIDLELIPVSIMAQNSGLAKIDYINQGEDYELAFTAPQAKAELISEIAQQLKVQVTRIGKVTGGDSVWERPRLLDANGHALEYSAGWNHFSNISL